MNGIVLIFLAVGCWTLCHGISESERVENWHKKHGTWPPNWHEETPRQKAKNAAREVEIMQIPGSQERWENWMQFVAGQLTPKLTPVGFKLVTTPPAVQAKLKAKLDEALEDWDSIPLESKVDVMYGPLKSKFVHIGPLAWEVAEDLRPLHEEWAGIKLRATSSYGIRLNQNMSSLVMHYDKTLTHVISSIVHIGHLYDDDNRPWPIQIDDHDGNTHSVVLEPGQMLFYESARCLHGRMSQLHGKYYASIFVHFQPEDRSMWTYDRQDVIDAVPPHWRDGVVEPQGSRWAGQGLTIDSLACAGSAPRVVNGEYIHDRKSAFAEL